MNDKAAGIYKSKHGEREEYSFSLFTPQPPPLKLSTLLQVTTMRISANITWGITFKLTSFFYYRRLNLLQTFFVAAPCRPYLGTPSKTEHLSNEAPPSREGGNERSFQGVSEDRPEIDSFRTKNVD